MRKDLFWKLLALLMFVAFLEQRWELIQLQKRFNHYDELAIRNEQLINALAPKPEINPILHIKPNIDPTLANRIYRTVKFASSMYDVPEEVILSIILTESSFNPRAVSSSAVGLMQINPRAWKIYNKDILFDPVINILLGTRIASYYYTKTGSWQKALFYYSAGARNYIGKNFEHLITFLKVKDDEIDSILIIEP